MGSEIVESYVIKGHTVWVYGCWDADTSKSGYDFWDIEIKDQGCANLGMPFYDGEPDETQVREVVEAYI